MKTLEIFPDKLSASNSKIEIPPEVHSEYISYHDKIDRNNYEYQKAIKESKELFRKNVLPEKKKEILDLCCFVSK